MNAPKEEKKDRLVKVMVDDKEYEIERGNYIVKDLKSRLGIEATRELVEIKGKKTIPLTDDDKVNIAGGEIFVTHGQSGTSS